MTALPIILRITSLAPIGLASGHSSKGISRDANKVSRDLSEVIESLSFREIGATDFLRSSQIFEVMLVATATLSINGESVSVFFLLQEFLNY